MHKSYSVPNVVRLTIKISASAINFIFSESLGPIATRHPESCLICGILFDFRLTCY